MILQCDPHLIDTEAGGRECTLYVQRQVAIESGCPQHESACPLLALPEPTRWQRLKWGLTR